MPEEGIDYVPREELLTYEEMLRIVRIMGSLGVHKIRITGGEPFVRKDILPFMQAVTQMPDIKSLHITTNGVLTTRYVPELQKMDIASVNLSLDSVDAKRFFAITRRNVLDKVLGCVDALVSAEIHTKINIVVMGGENEADIIPMAMLSKDRPLHVRYIEEMPFNGGGKDHKVIVDYQSITTILHAQFSNMIKMPDPENTTAYHYKIPGHKGTVAVIPAYSRTICGSCNRIRITPQGILKTCLYDRGIFDLRLLMRNGASDVQIESAIREAVAHRAKNGFEAEQQTRNASTGHFESMAGIGG